MFTRIADRYRNCTAVIVGAGGIGAAIARLLAGTASRLIIADHQPALLEALKRELGSTTVETCAVDVRRSESVNDFFRFVNGGGSPPEFLFYTAGILDLQSLAETTPAIWDRAVQVNLNGAFYCVHAAAELMIPRQQGSILILGSIAGTKSRSGSRVNPVYNTTKAALAAFVNAAAMQLRSQGIRINCISPGPTATTMMDLQPRHVHDAISTITLDQRQNDPMEVAELALFVAAHGRFTGEDLAMGGGAGLGG